MTVVKSWQHLLIIFVIAVFVFGYSAVEAKKRGQGYQGSCQAVIFSDSTRFKRLYGKNVNQRVFPASTTKVMTALVVLEHLPLDKYVTVNVTATYPQPSKIYVKPGEQYRVRDLLYAILMSSANDASVVLAEAAAGSEKKFVELMNKRARQLGARHTRFANAHGLPSSKEGQYTTAYDMYLIFRQALKYDSFREAIRYKYKTIYTKQGRKVPLTSHNKILFRDWKKKSLWKNGIYEGG